MKSILMIAVLFGSLFFNPVGMSFAEEATDFHQQARIQRLITAIEVGDHETVLQLIDQMEKSGVDTGGEILFYKALSSEALGKFYDASVSAEEYLKLYGREGKHYQSALEIFGSATESFDNYFIADYLQKSPIYKTKDKWLELKKSEKFNHYFESYNNEYYLFDNSIKDNGDGTISFFYATEKPDGTYGIHELIWLACPVGSSYNAKGPSCDWEKHVSYGAIPKHDYNSIAELERNFVHNGKSDWRLPEGKELLNMISKHKELDMFNVTVHDYIFSRAPLLDFNLPSGRYYPPRRIDQNSFNSWILAKEGNGTCIYSRGVSKNCEYNNEIRSGLNYMVRGPFYKGDVTVSIIGDFVMCNEDTISYKEASCLFEMSDGITRIYFVKN